MAATDNTCPNGHSFLRVKYDQRMFTHRFQCPMCRARAELTDDQVRQHLVIGSFGGTAPPMRLVISGNRYIF
jgi:hypothetical protein